MCIFAVRCNGPRGGQHDGAAQHRSVKTEGFEDQHTRCRAFEDSCHIVKAIRIAPAGVVSGNLRADESIAASSTQEERCKQPDDDVSPLISTHGRCLSCALFKSVTIDDRRTALLSAPLVEATARGSPNASRPMSGGAGQCRSRWPLHRSIAGPGLSIRLLSHHSRLAECTH